MGTTSAVTVRIVSVSVAADRGRTRRAWATRLSPGSRAVTRETVTIEWGRKKIR